MSIEEQLDAVRGELLDWYDAAGRTFPWREEADPFAILVLEVMSQQTQLGRIADAWAAFIDRWPTPEALASSPPGDVIAFWSDHRLGYNRRAEYLHSAATHIVEEWNGDLPADPAQLAELDGVGPYTSHAVASFAFDAPHAVVDTNVERVLRRAFDVESDFAEQANELLPPDEAARWNNAIMDLGATVCTDTPACDRAPCPWRSHCVAYETDSFDLPQRTSQSSFEGSRRQYRGRIVRTLTDVEQLELDALGERVHEEYGTSEGIDRSWLASIVQDLAADGLVTFDPAASVVSLPNERD